MKKAVALLLILILTGSAFADEYYVLCRPGSEVNVRERPKLKSLAVASVSFGRKVEGDREQNGFIHVTGLNAEVEEGWIYKGLLIRDEPTALTARVDVFGAWRVACRKYADRKSKIVKWAYDGESVTVYAISEEWCVTDRGFIRTEFLTLNAKVKQ